MRRSFCGLHTNAQVKINSTKANQQLKVEMAGTWDVVEKFPIETGDTSIYGYKIVIGREGNRNRKMILATGRQKESWETIVVGDRIIFSVPPDCITNDDVIPKRL